MVAWSPTKRWSATAGSPTPERADVVPLRGPVPPQAASSGTHGKFIKILANFSKIFTNFASTIAFFSIFQNLQNYLAEFSKSCKIMPKFRFCRKSASFAKKSAIVAKFKSGHFPKFCKKLRILVAIFTKICDNKILKIQRENCADFEKCCKMRIWMQNFVSIQTRTSLKKSDVSWPMYVCAAKGEAALTVRACAATAAACTFRHATISHDPSLEPRSARVLGCIETKFCKNCAQKLTNQKLWKNIVLSLRKNIILSQSLPKFADSGKFQQNVDWSLTKISKLQ